jgi:hypothetical protein
MNYNSNPSHPEVIHIPFSLFIINLLGNLGFILSIEVYQSLFNLSKEIMQICSNQTIAEVHSKRTISRH